MSDLKDILSKQLGTDFEVQGEQEEFVEPVVENEVPKVENEVEPEVKVEEPKNEVVIDNSEFEAKIKALEEELNTYKGKKSIEDEVSPESVELMRKLLHSGLDMKKIKEIAEVNTLDVDALGDEEAISKYLSKKEGLTSEEINVELKRLRKLKNADTSLMDEDEKDQLEADLSKFKRLEREAKKYLGELKNSDEYKLPSLKDNKANQELAEKEYNELVTMYNKEVSSNVDDVKELSFSINDKESFTFKLNDDQRTALKDGMLNINEFYKNFVTEKGVDYSRMKNTLAAGLFLPEILKAAMNSVENKGEANVLNEINNIDSQTKTKAPVKSNSVLESIVASYRQNNIV